MSTTPDLRWLLACGARGDAVPWFGARPGDPADHLATEVFTDADYDADEARRYEGRVVYLLHDDGSEEALPLHVRIERAVAGSGVLRVASLALRVEQGQFVRVFVHGEPLVALGLRSEEDVEAQLGPFDGHELNRGEVVFHAPARALSACWSRRERKLSYLCLGQIAWQEPELGARALLCDLVRWREAFERSKWKQPSASEPLAYYAYARAAALAHALGLGSVEAAAQGTFIACSDRERYMPLLSGFAARYLERWSSDALVWSVESITFMYCYLTAYLCRAQTLLAYNTGWLETSPRIDLLIRATETANRALRQPLAAIEDLLAGILDPDNRLFKRKLLIEQYGYPDVDIARLEAQESD